LKRPLAVLAGALITVTLPMKKPKSIQLQETSDKLAVKALNKSKKASVTISPKERKALKHEAKTPKMLSELTAKSAVARRNDGL
jgi:hypothetical protein